MLVFTANHCPTAQAYEGRIERLHADFSGRGVQIVLVSPNDPLALRLDEQGYTDLGDTLADMKIRAKDRGWTFPYLYDGETEAMSRQYGPVATPHVFVFDAERKLRFVGRVDDGENPAKVTTSDARNAIEAVLAGKPVPVETTKVFGCSVKWSDKRPWVKEGYEKWAQEPVTLETIDEAGVKALARNEGGKKLRLVNVWATWCGPCVIEFPDLVSLNRIYRGREFEVVTVNADEAGKREKALEFLKTQQASTRNVAFDKGDPYALIEAVDPKWQGALPHTIVVAPGGEVIYRSEGAFDTLEAPQGDRGVARALLLLDAGRKVRCVHRGSSSEGSWSPLSVSSPPCPPSRRRPSAPILAPERASSRRRSSPPRRTARSSPSSRACASPT